MVIFDIDGFLADIDERKSLILKNKKNEEIDWEEFFREIDKDKPIHSGLLIVKAFIEYLPQVDIMFLTCRMESVRKETLVWLAKHLGVPEDRIDLTMRPSNNFSEDYIFKEQVGKELGFKNIDIAFDDNDKIIDMWCRHNVPCCKFFQRGANCG